MADEGDLNLADLLMTECSWTSFAKVVQIGLDEVKNNWNTHYIRKSRFETVSGRPDSLYTIPEVHGGIDGLIVPFMISWWKSVTIRWITMSIFNM